MRRRRTRWVGQQLSKRTLGEGYLVGITATLFVILAGLGWLEGLQFTPWIVFGGLAVGALFAVIYLLRCCGLESGQVWRIAQYGAVGTACVAFVLVVTQFTQRAFWTSSELTVVLLVGVAVTTGGGALVGLVRELHRTAERLRLRKSVLYRVLQHNLRNDMTVVLTHLDSVKDSLDEPEREELELAKRKIQSLVDLTEKVRRINIAAEADVQHATTTDLTPVIEERVQLLQSRYPNLELSLSLPPTTPVYANRQFGLVIDNIVESSLRYSRKSPNLEITVTMESDTASIRVVDENRTIPDADLSALEQRTEDVFNHGYGVELWLVYWLTERNGGEVCIENVEETRALEIQLDRVRNLS